MAAASTRKHRPNGPKAGHELTITLDQSVWAAHLHREMAELIDDATLLVVEDAGHLTTLEAPKEVLRALSSWLVSS